MDNQSTPQEEHETVRPMSQTATATPRERNTNKPWLPWVIIGGVVLLILIIAGIFLAITKGQADTAGKDYLSDSKSYLNEYADKVKASSDPSEAYDDVKDLKQPELKSVAMGPLLSADYKKALDSKDKVESTIKDANSDLEGYAHLSDFVKKYRAQLTKIQASVVNTPNTRSEADIWFKRLEPMMQDTKKTVEDFKAPQDMKSAKADLADAVDQELSAIKKMHEAVVGNNKTAYQSAASDFKQAAAKEADAISELSKKAPDNAKDKLYDKLHDTANSL